MIVAMAIKISKFCYMLPVHKNIMLLTFYVFGLLCYLVSIMNTNIITIIGLCAAFCTTFSFLPQAIQTIKTKDTSGISLSMYSLFAFGTLLWFTYGLLSVNLPVSIANGITLVFASIILVYKVRYK